MEKYFLKMDTKVKINYVISLKKMKLEESVKEKNELTTNSERKWKFHFIVALNSLVQKFHYKMLSTWV